MVSERDCPDCGHPHEKNPCNIVRFRTLTVDESFPEGCGCTAVIYNTTCPTCGQGYHCPTEHAVHECWSCWANTQDRDAAERFATLTDALAKRLEVQPEPWMMGGWTYCLAIPVPKPAYVLVSDHWQEELVLGLYWDDEDEGDYPEPPKDLDGQDPEAVADWIVPIVLGFAEKAGERHADV